MNTNVNTKTATNTNTNTSTNTIARGGAPAARRRSPPWARARTPRERICIHVCIYIYIYIYTHTFIYIFIHIFISLYMYIYTHCIHAYARRAISGVSRARVYDMFLHGFYADSSCSVYLCVLWFYVFVHNWHVTWHGPLPPRNYCEPFLVCTDRTNTSTRPRTDTDPSIDTQTLSSQLEGTKGVPRNGGRK